MSFRLCWRAPLTTSSPRSDGATAGGDHHAAAAGEVIARHRVLVLEKSFQLAGVDDLAAVLPRPRPDVDHMIRDANRLLVVLDNDEHVSHVAKSHERVDQPPVVALVQPDRGLVQHIENADKARADLRGQSDALSLTTRERCRVPRQRQVVQSDVQEKAKPGMNLLQQSLGDECFAVVELELAEEVVDVADGQVLTCAMFSIPRVLPPETRVGAARPCTSGTAPLGSTARSVRGVVRVGLVSPTLEPRDDALEHRPVGTLPSVAVLVADVDVLGFVAVEDRLRALFGSFLNGTSVRKPNVDAAASMSRVKYSLLPDHGATAPSSSVRSGSGITSSMSTSR